MFKSLTVAVVAAAAAAGVQAQEFNLQPESKGAEIQVPASANLRFKNDLATITLYVTAEESSLAAAQSKVNETMSKAQKAIKDFSSLARIENGSYYTQAVYTNPKKGEAPKIAAWRARQSIRIQTEDVDGVASLVQVAQQEHLGLDNVTYGLTEDARVAAQDKLSKAVIQALNQKAESIAIAMKIPPQSLKIKKLEFMNSDFGEGVVLARSFAVNSMAKADVAAPSFEAGTSRLTMSVNATLSVEGEAVP